MENLKKQLAEKKAQLEKVKDVPYQYKNVLNEIAELENQIAGGKPSTKKVSPAKTEKVEKPKTAHVPATTDATLLKEPKVAEIMNKYTKNKDKHYQLSLLGYNNKQIQSITGAPLPSIARDIWQSKKS